MQLIINLLIMKLLLVEDEVEIANFLTRGFKYEGYKVKHILDGSSVIDIILKNTFDIIILDLGLPKMGGQKVLKKMRAQKILTPVIILTGEVGVETKSKMLNIGADDYLTKPFSFIELLARVRAVLRRSKNRVQPSETLNVGDLKLISSMRMVTRNGKLIKLRLKEYDLLECLMRNPNQVITRNTLLENIWDYNANIFSNTIDAHISSLRKKLNKGFDKEIIETIHGVGYILKAE